MLVSRLITVFTLLMAAASLSACCGGPFHGWCGGGHGWHGGGGYGHP